MLSSNRGNRPRFLTGESFATKGTTAGSVISSNGNQDKVPDVVITAPTSTTKALLLSIAVPKIYRVYIPPKEQPEAIADSKAKDAGPGVIKKVPSKAKAEEIKPSQESAVHPLLRDTKLDVHPLKKGVSSLSSENETETSTDGIAPTPKTKTNRKKMLRREPSLEPDLQKVFANGTDLPPKEQAIQDSAETKSVSTDSKMDTKKNKEGAGNEDEKVEEEIRVIKIENKEQEHEAAEEVEVPVHYVENDNTGNRNASIVEHVITKEEMDMVVKIEANDSESLGTLEEIGDSIVDMPSQLNSEPPHHKRVTTDSSLFMAAGEALKNFFGVVNNNNESKPTQYLTQEETVAAIKQYASVGAMDKLIDEKSSKSDEKKTAEGIPSNVPRPNTEIKLEALLRFTFRNLYNEDHFFNAPICTDISSRDPQDTTDGPQEEWIELSVMVKQASIGTILERMERIGVGSSVGTIAIFKTELLRTCATAQIEDNETSQQPKDQNQEKKESGQNKEAEAQAVAEKAAKLEAARAEWRNAASRLRVEQVKEQIQEQAELSLDYLSLLTIASILAGIGLITDNSVVIVASMLVSPIMGPVMGITFGSRVLDWNLALRSMYNEFISLLLAVLIGAIIGLCTSFAPVADSWPTEQMSSRGDTTGLVTGIAIAIPSGMGVALSILGNNTSSLVGVAISASLLPPAVNAGICWVFAIVGRISNTYGNQNDEDNFNLIAGISFALTMVNIVCIWFSGILMFQIKEVAPTKTKSAFWARDIKVARAVQKGTTTINEDVIKAGLQDVIKKERQKLKKVGTSQKRRGETRLNWNMQSNLVDEDAKIVDINKFMDPSTQNDDAVHDINNKYVGLDNMSGFLGFGIEDDDFEGEEMTV